MQRYLSLYWFPYQCQYILDSCSFYSLYVFNSLKLSSLHLSVSRASQELPSCRWQFQGAARGMRLTGHAPPLAWWAALALGWDLNGNETPSWPLPSLLSLWSVFRFISDPCLALAADPTGAWPACHSTLVAATSGTRYYVASLGLLLGRRSLCSAEWGTQRTRCVRLTSHWWAHIN